MQQILKQFSLSYNHLRMVYFSLYISKTTYKQYYTIKDKTIQSKENKSMRLMWAKYIGDDEGLCKVSK